MGQNVFHVSLGVADIPAAIDHYRTILGIEPAKVRPDYAKFELTDPPVILSLNLGATPGKVGHLGIRYPATGDLMTERVRVRNAGAEILVEEGARCCYATADKFWVRDADGMPWEMYTVTGDSDVYVSLPPGASATSERSSG